MEKIIRSIIKHATCLFVSFLAYTPLFAQYQVCPGDTVCLTLGNYYGNIQWQESADSSVWTDIQGATTDTFCVAVNDTAYYRAVVTNGSCDPYSSDTSLVLTYPLGGTQSFSFTGQMDTFIVPQCVDSVYIEAYGAEGANANDRLPSNTSGGLGGFAAGSLAVAPGDTLFILVGELGNVNGTGGWNGGGDGGVSTAGGSCSGGPAGGGGGASDVRKGGAAWSNIVIAAGGGGGSGRDYCNGGCQPCGCGGGQGGGGGLTGIDGDAAYNCGYGYSGQGINGGKGGTPSSGGNGGSGDNGGPSGTPGTQSQGGNGANGNYDVAGGGGGGGYYGGGGGGSASSGSGVGGGGGGGGSSYLGGVTSATTTPATHSGNGQIIISW